MKLKLIVLVIVGLLLTGITAYAMEGMEGHATGHETGHQTSDKAADSSGHGAMGKTEPKWFVHHEDSEGVQAEFQIMSLASMNMKDEKGATHHVMVKLVDSATQKQIKQAVGKIKVIGPDKKEQVSDLVDYSGILAANVNFDAPGKYGIICLFKAQGRKHLIKFWYPHQG